MVLETHQLDSTESDQLCSIDLDSDDDIVELAPLAQHVDHEVFDYSYDKENDKENADAVTCKDPAQNDKRHHRNHRDSQGLEQERIVQFAKRNDNIVNILKFCKCDFCQQQFHDAYGVRKHMISHGYLEDSQTNQLDVKVHRAKSRPRPKLEIKVEENNNVCCDICKEYFPTDIEIMVHKQDDHGVCSVCNITLPSCDTLQQHLDTHLDPTLQRCLICGSGFLARVALLHHIKNEHADPCHHQAVYDTINECDKQSPDPGLNMFLFRCPYCRRMFPQKQDCLDHMKTHNSELKCKQCPEEFKHFSKLLNHSFKHSKNSHVKCSVCLRNVTKNRKCFRRHSECDQRILYCSRCGWSYTNMFIFTKHMVKHYTDVVLKCDQCEKTFKSLTSLKVHNKLHDKTQNFTCRFCKLIFKDRVKLKKHHKENHKNTDGSERFECKICNNLFDNKKMLTKHLTCHRPKTLKCHFCPMMYKSKMHLKYHESTHTGEKKYACDICKKTFTQPSALKTHDLVHSGIRAFKCSECDKSFKTQSQLKYHMFTHTGERPYVCNICGKGFTNQTHKKTHMRTHTGETPYLCQHCGAAYPTNGQLQTHVLTHTGETPFLCHHCGTTFPSNAQLQKHDFMHQ